MQRESSLQLFSNAQSDTEACALHAVSINDFSDTGRIRPNTAFLTRFVGSIERSNLRHAAAERPTSEESQALETNENTIEEFRAEGRKKMLQLADYYGFAVQIKVKTSKPVGFKRKIKLDDTSCRLGDVPSASDKIQSDISKSITKKVCPN